MEEEGGSLSRVCQEETSAQGATVLRLKGAQTRRHGSRGECSHHSDGERREKKKVGRTRGGLFSFFFLF